MADLFHKLRFIFNRRQKWETLGLFAMIVIGTAFELLGVSMIQPLINAISETDKMMKKPFYQKIMLTLHLKTSLQLIICMLIMLVFIYIVKNVYLILMYRQQYKYIYSNMRYLSTKMMRSYLSRPYSYFIKKSSAELLRNINQDTADFFGVIQALVQLATEGMVVLALIIYLFIKDKTITICVGFLLGLFIFTFFRIYKLKLLEMGNRNREYETELNKWIQQAFGGIKEVKVQGKEDFFYRRYDDAFHERVKSEYTYHTMITIPKPLIEAIAIVALLGTAVIKILCFGTHLNYFIPTFSIFVIAAYRLLPSFNRITEYMGTIAYQKPAVSAIYQDLQEIEQYEFECTSGQKKEARALPLHSGIQLRNISFRYPGHEKLILEHISFDIIKNTSVAFIGQSGAGKTTLADLILGVLTPVEGSICVDGESIIDNLDDWHKTVGYIPQNIYLMDDTIEANIAFGISEDEINQERLWRAIEKAQLLETIQELPDGLKTVVGERGVRFSGGQQQRIGIARALYNEPKVLVLDEATSALDTETEAAVMEAINALHGEMTMIIIAHRLSTIQNCDQVYRIGAGRAILEDCRKCDNKIRHVQD